MALSVVFLVLFICFDGCTSHSKLSHYGSHGAGDVHYNHLMKHPDCQCDGCAGAYSEWGTCLVAYSDVNGECGDGVQFRNTTFMTGESCCSRSCSSANILLQKRPCPITGHTACDEEGTPLICNYEDGIFDPTNCAIATSVTDTNSDYQMVLSASTGTSSIQYVVNGSPPGVSIFGFAVADAYAFPDGENTPRYFCLTYKYQLLKNDIIKAFAFPSQIKSPATEDEQTVIVRAAILQNRKLLHTDERSQDMTAPVEVKRTFQHYGDFRIGFVIFPSAVPTAPVEVIYAFSVTSGKCT